MLFMKTKHSYFSAAYSRGIDNIPDETTILNFRHLLERHNLSKAIFEEVKAILAAKGLLLKEGSVVMRPSSMHRPRRRIVVVAVIQKCIQQRRAISGTLV